MIKNKPNNFIGEWFGYRLYPDVKCRADQVSDLQSGLCPFLSEITGRDCLCEKPTASQGVCTITTTKSGTKDWMVCPYRSLDNAFLTSVVERIFGCKDSPYIIPVSSLAYSQILSELKTAVANGQPAFLFFQDKLGGEINVPPTAESPELKFDITLVPVSFSGNTLQIHEFAIYEVQTMDFHGSYRHAVNALQSAVDLHGERFPQEVGKNSDWLGRKIEGPNIANVFKRTFYQLLLKFRLAEEHTCAGVALGLPEAVWDSWSPHLNSPTLQPYSDYRVLEGTDPERLSNSWIFVFETDRNSDAAREPLQSRYQIRVDVDALLRLAFSDVPDYISHNLVDRVRAGITRRVSEVYPSVEWGGSK